MSVPSGLTKRQKEVMARAINYPLYKEGDVVEEEYSETRRYRLLENSTAHGCPLVENIATGEQSHMTMNGHMQVFKELCDEAGICHHTD